MGRLCEAVFGRATLPESCLIYAGAYLPARKEWVRNLFDKWQRIEGQWVKYTFAHKHGSEYVIIFNVYGASMTLEIIELLKEGGAAKVFFIGSLGGKDLPVGTLVLPTRVVDKTGIVSADEPRKKVVRPDKRTVRSIKKTLKALGKAYVEGEIASVPCVLHNIEHIKGFIEKDPRLIGVECETSAFYHYSAKESLESYALLYVSDNRQHDIISGGKDLREARRKALQAITFVATEVLAGHKLQIPRRKKADT
jgi:purine-nucleoside phosphorylase